MYVPMMFFDGVDAVATFQNAPGFRVQYQKVDVDYLPTLGLSATSGRLPRRADNYDGRRVAVINRAMTERAGRNLVGTTLTISNEAPMVVVGEVPDLQSTGPVERSARVYEVTKTDLSQPYRMQYLITRVRPGSEARVIAAFSKGMRDRYPSRLPATTSTLRSRVEGAIAPQRYVARAAFGFGMIEMLLAAIGLYSLLLYAMLTRTREIGVRMALGAKPSSASFTIIKSGLEFVLAGLVLGGIAAIPAGIIAGRNFTGADARDPVPYAAAFIGIMIATIAAAYVPARRAARVEPMVALRHE